MNHHHKTHCSRIWYGLSVAGFTLVEMLTVMGVISILLVVGLPGFKGLNSGGLRRSAVNKIMGVLDQARAIAITEGKKTYVAFPVQNGSIDKTNQAKCGRSCAIFVEENNFNIIQRSAWIYLPDGVAFKLNANNGNGMAETSITNLFTDTQAPADAPSFPLPAASGAQSSSTPPSVQMPYFAFDITGSLYEPPTAFYSRVLIFQGVIDSAGGEIATKQTAGDVRLLLDEVRVNTATGRAKYITDPSDNLATPPPTQ